MKRRVYDFDKTIYAGDATAHFVRWCALRYPRVLLDLIASCPQFAAMGLGLVDKTRAKERFYGFLRFVPDVEGEVLAFWAAHAQGVKRWYLEQHEDSDLIISASPEFLLAPICRTLNVQLIASRVDPHSGKTAGLNCHGPEKAARLKSECPGTEIAAFYSDSRSDAPLAALAEAAYLVRGDRLLPW